MVAFLTLVRVVNLHSRLQDIQLTFGEEAKLGEEPTPRIGKGIWQTEAKQNTA